MRLALILAAAAFAGTTRIPVPGTQAWEGPWLAYEAPGSCASCAGPRAFAVLGGEPWFLLSERLVSGSGASLGLPSEGVDLAAGPDGLWVLCRDHLARLEGGELRLQETRWSGTPLEVSGEGVVMSDQGIDGRPFAEGQPSPWGAGLTLLEQDGRWSASWPDQPPLTLPGVHVVDARLVGRLAAGPSVVALTDSTDGSAPDAVRFLSVQPGRVGELAAGPPNGDLEVRPRRHYAVDPVDGGVYTLVVLDAERLSLRRY